MSILITGKPISIVYFILPVSKFDNFAFLGFILIIDIFYPSGEPISLQSLRCGPFEVVYYIFMGHGLAFAAISARE
jgi:hypothetical protein